MFPRGAIVLPTVRLRWGSRVSSPVGVAAVSALSTMTIIGKVKDQDENALMMRGGVGSARGGSSVMSGRRADDRDQEW